MKSNDARVRSIVQAAVLLVAATGSFAMEHPSIFLNSADIFAIKAKVQAGEEPWKSAHSKMLSDANSALNQSAQSVTDNGSRYSDPRDYCTDPPYLTDGVYDPNADRKDYSAATAMCKAIRRLGLAYAFTGQSSYAEKALALIRHWCLDANKKMNPKYTNSQSYIELSITIPGLFYGADLIWGYPGWASGEKQGLQDWATAFVASARSWSRSNNFENWRLVVVCSGSVIAERSTDLTWAFQHWKDLIPSQINTAGFMTKEIGRVGALGYSLYAINAMAQTAEIARHQGEDLYGYKLADGRGLELVWDKHVGYLLDQSTWPYTQPDPITGSSGSQAVYELAYASKQKTGYLNVINAFKRPMYEIRTMGCVTLTHACRGGSTPTPPAPPSQLSAAPVNAGRIDLSWKDNSADETGFKIDRRQSGTDAWVRIKTTGANATTHTDTGLAPETRYYYKVKAYNAAGNSAYTDLATAATPGGVPAAPSGFTATVLSATQVRLTWTDNSNNEENFKLRRSEDNIDYSYAVVVPADQTAYTDTGLQPGKVYCYKVKAEHATYGDSPYVGPVRVATPVQIEQGAAWRFRKGTAEASAPATAWRLPGFDDSGWPQGPAPFGYGGTEIATALTDMRGSYTSVFLRRAFTVHQPALVNELQLDIDYDDGCIVWINGQEVARLNVAGAPGTFVPYDACAAENRRASHSLTLAGAGLPALAQQNVIAVQVFNRSLDASGDLSFNAHFSFFILHSSLSADADMDAMPDAWEEAHLSDLADPADRSDSADPDRDGLSNLEEYIAGTDPMATPAEAPPGEGGFAVAVALEAGSVLVSFPAVAAAGVGYDGCTRHYSLERKSGSDTDTWLAVAGYADIVAAGQTVRYRPPTGDGSPVFYRARVWLAGP